MYVLRNIEERSCNHCCGKKAMIIAQSECVSVALSLQHAIRMHYIVSVASPALQYFSTLSHQGHHFRKEKKSY